MKILSQITPAETLLIKNSNSLQLKDLMKFTFMDLLLKKVIEIKEINKRPHPLDTIVVKYTYVIAGKNFKKYKPKNHELIYLSPFGKNISLQILFKHFIQIAHDYANSNWKYKKLTRSNQEINKYFKQAFWPNLFRINKLTKNGIILKNEISSYLNGIDEDIDNLLNNDTAKALKLLLSIGGNIFLLKNLDFQLLKHIDKELINQQKLLDGDNYDTDSDWWLYMDFFEDDNMFDSYFDSFDDTIDSFDSEFDTSDCSSCDSGCDGCD